MTTVERNDEIAETAVKRFWISWHQLTDDYRPLHDPPQPENIKGWWNSGTAADGSATLCAIVDAANEGAAESAVRQGWEAKDGEVGEFRFIEERESDWLPGNRFPITENSPETERALPQPYQPTGPKGGE